MKRISTFFRLLLGKATRQLGWGMWLAFLCFLFPREASAQETPADTLSVVTQEWPAEDTAAYLVGNYGYHFQEALRLEALNQYPEAVNQLALCIGIDSTQAGAYGELAALLEKAGRTESALTLWEKAQALDAGNDWYCLHLANLYQAGQQYGKAIEMLRLLVEHQPSRYDYHYYLAQLYIQTEQYKEALKAIDHYENYAGKDEESAKLRFVVLRSLGKPKKAFQEIVSLWKSQPDNVHYRLLIGVAYGDLGMEADARQFFLQTAADYPDNDEAQITLANYFLVNHEDSLFRRQCDTIVARRGLGLESKLFTLGYYLKQHPDDSLWIRESFAKVFSQFPAESQPHLVMAEWLLQTGHSDEALGELHRVLDTDPGQKDVWDDLLRIYFGRQDSANDTLVGLCREALRYFPKEPTFWYYLGVCQSVRKEYAEAMAAYESCVACLESGQTAQLSKILGYLGDLHYETGDTLSAYRLYEEALQADGSNVMVLNNYAYFLTQQGRDLDRAEQMARLAIKADPGNSTYLDTFAWVMFRQGRFDLAKIYIERAFIYLEEAEATLYEHYGDILWFCGETEAAWPEWQKAVYLSESPSAELQQKAATGTYLEHYEE